MTRQTSVLRKIRNHCQEATVHYGKDVDFSEERRFADEVLAGGAQACTRFVEEFTDPVLIRLRKLKKSHCQNHSSEQLCSLIVVLRMRRGWPNSIGEKQQCDECMDSYVWFLEHLKTRLKSYKGINGCSVKTYVRSVIYSHNTYIDWLRWKYGRII